MKTNVNLFLSLPPDLTVRLPVRLILFAWGVAIGLAFLCSLRSEMKIRDLRVSLEQAIDRQQLQEAVLRNALDAARNRFWIASKQQASAGQAEVQIQSSPLPPSSVSPEVRGSYVS